MRKIQAGQALPLALVLALFGVLGGLVLYNTGQSATEKARLANVADAAAYSGLQWQARALNFSGYTNRAMVANQVSLAQAVTLTSWTHYGAIMSGNLSRVLTAIPFLNAIAAGVDTVMETIRRVVEPVAQAMLSVIDGVNRGVSIAQEAMYQSSYIATPEIVTAVVKQSNPDFSAETAYTLGGVVGNLHTWQGFAERVSNTDSDIDHMRERADIIRDSRDPFTRARNWSLFGGFMWVVPGLQADLVKEGETRLIEAEGDNGLEWEWKAKDTMSLQTRTLSLFGWNYHELPIGYGEAIANTDEDVTIEAGACSSFAEWSNCKQWGRYNEDAERFADVNMRSLRGGDSRAEMSGYSGLNAFRRLTDETTESGFPTIKLRVEVEMDAQALTSSNEMVAAGVFQTPTQMPGSAMSSISIAEAYFKAPDVDHQGRQGESIEFANLYSPWWDVRLAPVSDLERLAAFTLRAGVDGVSELLDVDGNGSVVSGGDVLADAADGVLSDMVEDMFGDLADEAEQAIQDALVDVIETAVRDILNGVVSGATGGHVDADDVQGWVQDIAQDAADDSTSIQESVDESMREVDALQAEFARIDAVMNERFPPVFDTHVADYEARTFALRQRLAGQIGRPVGPFSVFRGTHFSDSSRELIRELDRERNSFIADLAVLYRDMVNEQTDRFEMTFGMARDVIVTAVAAYNANDGAIDWSLFGADLVEESMATTDEDVGDSDDESDA